MSELQVEYGEVVSDVVEAINREYELCLGSGKSSIEHATICGKLLSEQKSKLEHGEWLPWVMLNCKFGRKQAASYIKLASNVTRGLHFENADSINGALRLIAAADPKPKKLKAQESEGAFSWFKDKSYLDMESGIKAIESAIEIFNGTNQEKSVAIYIMQMLRKSLNNILQNLNNILGDTDD